jgi:hypothetical protein
MEHWDEFKTTMLASVCFSWAGLLIACFPSFLILAPLAPKPRRWHYVFAGLLGGVAGEFSAVHSLFLSLAAWCSHQGRPCNSAQGDLALLFFVPIGSCCGSLLAGAWTHLTLKIPKESVWSSVFVYAGPGKLCNWCSAIAVPLAFYVCVIYMLARLMA